MRKRRFEFIPPTQHAVEVYPLAPSHTSPAVSKRRESRGRVLSTRHSGYLFTCHGERRNTRRNRQYRNTLARLERNCLASASEPNKHGTGSQPLSSAVRLAGAVIFQRSSRSPPCPLALPTPPRSTPARETAPNNSTHDTLLPRIWKPRKKSIPSLQKPRRSSSMKSHEISSTRSRITSPMTLTFDPSERAPSCPNHGFNRTNNASSASSLSLRGA